MAGPAGFKGNSDRGRPASVRGPSLASGGYVAGQCAQSSWNGSSAEAPPAAPEPGRGRLIQGGSESESVQPESE